MAKADLTAARLRDLLHYDPETGIFTWRVSRWRVSKGEAAGNLNVVNGYTIIGIDRRTYRAHRLAWLYVFGGWPQADIDHINGIRDDNRLSNLRDVDRSTNLQNQTRARSNNKTSGLLGVCFSVKEQRWIAQLKTNGQPKRLGCFQTAEEAQQAYLAAKREHHQGCTI